MSFFFFAFLTSVIFTVFNKFDFVFFKLLLGFSTFCKERYL